MPPASHFPRTKWDVALRAVPLLALMSAGCGSNHAGVPDDLLAAVGRGGGGPGGGSGADGGGVADGAARSPYPPGPYGSRVGEVVSDLCFEGWQDPKGASYDPSKVERICLSDFRRDPGATLLLVESCAIWCGACRTEYEGNGAARPSLSGRLAERRARGFRILGTIFQTAESQPATPVDAASWASAFSVDFPFVADPDHQLGLFTSANVAPFNLLLDVRTMKVELALSGDEPSVLFGAVDRLLDAPPP